MKRIICFALILCMLGSLCQGTILPVSAATSLPSSVYLAQESSGTCTLSATAMMLRARMYLSNNEDWSQITESAIKSAAWISGTGLRYSFTYTLNGNSMTVAHASFGGSVSVSALKSVLDSHPEGIVFYVYDVPHAVFLTDYDGDTFYCADSASGYSGKRIPLASSYLGKKLGGQDAVLSAADDYWYVSKYSITETVTTTTYTVSYDANGGTGAPESQLKTEGQDLTLSAAVPTRAGYTFLGWAATADAVSADYQAGATYTDDKDVTLYAVWQLGCPDSHDYAAAVTEPTCTEQGYTTHTCSVCGDSYTDTYVDALGHIWAEGIVTVEPTEETEGELTSICAVCGETTTESIPVLESRYQVTYTSASISLAGDIGVNYYAQLSEDLAVAEGAYMEFTVAGQTQTVPVSEAEVDADGIYRFTCKVAAKQMTDTIVGQMYLADGTAVGEAKSYSVKAYCDAAIPAYSQYEDYAELVALMEAMLNYGGYSQVQFAYNTDNLANADLADTSLPTIAEADVAAYAHGATGSESGISVASVSLLLESNTTIRFYFNLDGSKSIDQYTFYVDGVEVTPVASNGQYYVDKVNVAAKDLDEMATVTVGGLTVNYCGLSYVRQVAVLYPSYYSESLVNVAKALYAYNQAANAYFA